MTTAMKIAFGSAALIVASLFAFPQATQAWKTDQSAGAVCSAENTGAIEWSFTNTEPNEAKYAMDVVARDPVTGNTSPKVTVNPGETATGVIDTGNSKLTDGTVEFDLTWTDGRQGVDSRTASYSAIDCSTTDVEQYPIPMEVITKCEANGEITFTWSADIDTQYDWPNTMVSVDFLNADGDVVEQIINTNQDFSAVDTYSDSYTGTPPEDAAYIRVWLHGYHYVGDGELVAEFWSDWQTKVIDCEVEEPEEEGEVLPTTLPNTGPAAVAVGALSASGLGLTVRNWLNSRNSLRNQLLGKK